MQTCVRCNLCGKQLDELDLREDFTIHTTAGYGSKYDMSRIDLRLCCDCFDRLVDECALSPVIGEVDYFGRVQLA